MEGAEVLLQLAIILAAARIAGEIVMHLGAPSVIGELLVFAELGRVAGVLQGEVYAAVVLVIVYTTVFSPFWIKLFYRRYCHSDALKDRCNP